MNGKNNLYKLRQIVKMNGETKTFEQNVEVEIIDRKDRYFRYTEKLDEHALDVVLRAGEDYIKIQRRGVIHMNFYFQEGEITDTFYESPAGRHLFQVATQSLEISDALISIEYDLLENGGVIGNYHYTLEKVG